jgi:hypothetical protein
LALLTTAKRDLALPLTSGLPAFRDALSHF